MFICGYLLEKPHRGKFNEYPKHASIEKEKRKIISKLSSNTL